MTALAVGGGEGAGGVFYEAEEHEDLVFYPGLAVEVADVDFYCSGCDIEMGGDFFVTKTTADEPGNLQFAWGDFVPSLQILPLPVRQE